MVSTSISGDKDKGKRLKIHFKPISTSKVLFRRGVNRGGGGYLNEIAHR